MTGQRQRSVLMLLLLPWVLLFLRAGALSLPDEVRVLMDLKAAFVNGESELTDWDTASQSPCGWKGVTCDNVTFEVTSLNLSERALGGEISTSIGLLASLQILDLSGNNMTGQIPVELCNCTSLTHLDLSANGLNGEIPYLLSQLQYLEILNLRANKLSGPIPSSFSGLSNLRRLMLKSNQFTGGLTDDMCKLTQLAYFNVRDNKLSGPLPEGIGNCTSFQILDLSYNNFTGNIPYNIGYLQISTLSLESNMLTGGIPDVLGLMQALVILDLSNNLLEGEIPPILGNLTSLTKLYLYNNNFSGPIPTEFGNMSRLNYLELSNNSLTGEIPSELSYLTGLFELDLSENQLSGPIPENLSSLAALNLLNVHGNQLSGSISPELQQLTNLTLLNLASNNFTGPVPEEIGNIVNLDILNLSSNCLSGQIPSSIANLEHLLHIDLHKNRLNGSIPMAFGSLKSLGYLDLSENHLQGPIPLELGQLVELQFLNLSYNHLSGAIPRDQIFMKFPASSYIGNPLLCTNISSSCGLNPLHPREMATQRPGTLGSSATWGITISALCLLALLIIVAIRYAQPRVFLKGSNKTAQGPPSFVIFHLGMAPQSYDEMMRLTENLGEKYVIGRGGSSKVYRCCLKNGHPIAVKKLYNQFSQDVHEFENELRTLGNIKHRNLVTLRGYSMSSIGNFLFYDYMENGSLYDHLHGHGRAMLDWTTRLKIASGAAQGLAYLHKDCKPQVVHRDVKSCNILLDGDMVAHVADFGIAKNIQPARTHTSTHVLGTIGYIDPEYAQTSRLNEKSDVYSFGIVLLELLSNKKAVDDEVNLLDWVMRQLEGKAIQDVIDPHVRATCKDVNALEKTLKLALLCAKLNPSHRPSMYDVSQVLLSLLMQSDDYPSSNSFPAPNQHRRYVDMYSSKEALSLSNSSSEDTLLYQFKEAISRKL